MTSVAAGSAAVPLVDVVAQAQERFARAGVAANEALADAEVLARHALGWDRATWIARRRDPAPPGFAARYAPLAARRRSGSRFRSSPGAASSGGSRSRWGRRC